MRKDGNETARKLYLSRPERNKGVSLEYDDELKVWIKGGTEFFEDRFNRWEPFDEAKIFARNSKASNRRGAQRANGGRGSRRTWVGADCLPVPRGPDA